MKRNGRYYAAQRKKNNNLHGKPKPKKSDEEIIEHGRKQVKKRQASIEAGAKKYRDLKELRRKKNGS